MDDVEMLLIEIKADVASLKTDCAWVKRIMAGGIIVLATAFGIDLTGVI